MLGVCPTDTHTRSNRCCDEERIVPVAVGVSRVRNRRARLLCAAVGIPGSMAKRFLTAIGS